MSKRISDDKLREYLNQLNKESLVEWLIEQCQDNNKLRSSMLDLAAPKDAAKSLTSEIRSRITNAWAKVRGRDGYRQALAISRELDLVLQSIDSLITKGCYTEAEKLLVRYIEAAEKYGVNVDDSYGYLWPTCQAGFTLWGKVWAKIELRDKIKLAELVYAHIHDNVNGLKDNIVTDFKDALGIEGLQHLKVKLLKDYKALPESERYMLCGQLENIADALDDVDFFIELHQGENKISREAVPIARRLYQARRYDEALKYIERTDRSRFGSELYNYATLKSKILIALGRSDDAVKTLWNDFSKNLSSSTLKNILQLSDSEQREEIRQRAYKLAIEHNYIYDSMRFLTEEDQLLVAANLIEQRQNEISGEAYYSILPVAGKLKKQFPAQAWILFKALAVDILESSRYKAYGHAADYVKIMEQLSKQAEIDNKQNDFCEYLKQKHARKSSFWEKLNFCD